MKLKGFKLIIAISLILSLMVVAVGCGKQETADNQNGTGEKIVIKLGNVLDINHPWNVAAQKFADLVAEKTNGTAEVKLFPSAQLGSERQLIEGVQAGTIEMAITSTGASNIFVPEYLIFDLPYLFKDYDEAFKVLDGEFGKKMSDLWLQKLGVRNLAWWDTGFRSIYSKDKIESLADLNGLKIRSMETSAYMNFFKALGMSPVPMAYGELYTALQQGTVDAAENCLSNYATSKHCEVAPYMVMTNHTFSPTLVQINEKFFQGLPTDIQNAIVEAIDEVTPYYRDLFIEVEEELMETLPKENNVVFTELKDMDKVQAIAEEVREQVAKEDIPNGQQLLEEINEALSK
jgi:tripartite ATP-independent transporter DctP family solute receptor